MSKYYFIHKDSKILGVEEGGEEHDKNNASHVTSQQQTKNEIISVCQYGKVCV